MQSGKLSCAESTGFTPYLSRSSGPCDGNFLSKTVPSNRSDDFGTPRKSNLLENDSSIVLTAQSQLTEDLELQAAYQRVEGPTEEQIKEVALEVARIGDKIQAEYEKKYNVGFNIDADLT